jgi:heme/copper-type cytochrome/quinol oxidase subunit 2
MHDNAMLDNYRGPPTKRSAQRWALCVFLAALFGPLTGVAFAAGDLGHAVRSVHTMLLSGFIVAFLLVFAGMLYSIIRHRLKGARGRTTFHRSTAVELAWSLIPLLIVVVMALPSATTVLKQEITGVDRLALQAASLQYHAHNEPGAGD